VFGRGYQHGMVFRNQRFEGMRGFRESMLCLPISIIDRKLEIDEP
jgi:hypothetical protein